MRCEAVKLKGGTAFVCGSARKPHCQFCSRPATKLCDYPLGPGRTCDAKICAGHALHFHPDADICPNHQRAFGQEQGSLFAP